MYSWSRRLASAVWGGIYDLVFKVWGLGSGSSGVGSEIWGRRSNVEDMVSAVYHVMTEA